MGTETILIISIPFAAISLYLWIDYKRVQNKIRKINSLDFESKKIEILKLQAKMSTYNTSHLLHFFLSIFTSGLWIIPWMLISMSNSSYRKEIQKIIDSIH